MDAPAEPSLAPPGAGLPPLELFFARLAFRAFVWRGGREVFTDKFQKEHQRIQALISRCDADTGGRQVLIPRPRGLEDSSRHWSVWMTLEHLRLMHGAVRKVITALDRGISLQGTASTAAVKPAPGITVDVMESYEESCADLLRTVERVQDLKTPLKFPHPWFGPLDAGGWYAMAAFHLSLHRAQIQQILRMLPQN